MRRAFLAFAMCALVWPRTAAETSGHERLSVRRPETVAVSLDLDLELAAPAAWFLEGACILGLGVDIGGWLDVGLSVPVCAALDAGPDCRKASRLELSPGRGELRLSLSFPAGAWRFSGDATLGFAPPRGAEAPTSTHSCSLTFGVLRFLDPLALGASLSAEASLAGNPAAAPEAQPLVLSLGLLALEALNSEASLIFQIGQSLSGPGIGGAWREGGGWEYSVAFGLRLVFARDSWGWRVGLSGLRSPRFQAGASLVLRPGSPGAPSP